MRRASLVALMGWLGSGCLAPVPALVAVEEAPLAPAPPPIVVETPGYPPFPSAMWIEGRWSWNGVRFAWIGGH